MSSEGLPAEAGTKSAPLPLDEGAAKTHSLGRERGKSPTGFIPVRNRGITRHSLGRIGHYLPLSIVVLGAALLALEWVFLVPIFEAPDEPAHFDYAASIFHAGHLLNARDGAPGTADPISDYLIERSGVLYIHFNPLVKVSRDYGTDAYYASTDRNAPGGAITLQGIPYLLAIYPFGYYAALALWIGLVHQISHGVVAMFFGARVFSVVLMVASLLLSFGIMRELRVPRWRAIFIVAAIGFFPLTTFVSSYVQPDNLTFTLVTLSIYAALRLKRSAGSPSFLPWSALLGASLGLLAVTKAQVFLVIAVAVALMLATESLSIRKESAQRWITAVAILVGPTLALGAVHLWVTSGATSGAILHNEVIPGRVSDVAIRQAIHAGPGPLAAYIARTGEDAFTDYYLGGSYGSFLGTFGWLDAPLIIRSPNITEAIRRLGGIITVVVLALSMMRLEQVLTRLARVARRGRPRTALKLAFGNPLYTSFLLFSLFMIAFYIWTNDTFGAQGRNWLPFILAIFLIGLDYAPRALSHRLTRAAISTALCCALGLYCVVGSYYALETIRGRYYPVVSTLPAGNLTKQPGLALGAVDHLNGLLASNANTQVVVVGRGATMYIDGWAADGQAAAPAGNVVVTIDGKAEWPVVYGLDRPDVVSAFKRDAYAKTGFNLVFTTDDLSPGFHTLTVEVVSAGGQTYDLLPESFRFEVR